MNECVLRAARRPRGRLRRGGEGEVRLLHEVRGAELRVLRVFEIEGHSPQDGGGGESRE